MCRGGIITANLCSRKFGPVPGPGQQVAVGPLQALPGLASAAGRLHSKSESANQVICVTSTVDLRPLQHGMICVGVRSFNGSMKSFQLEIKTCI